MDVKALYTNISDHEGIEAVKETLNNQAKKSLATQVIIKLLYLTLILNNFLCMYLQKIHQEKNTLAYGDIFMTKFEKLHIYPYLRNFSVFYSQFIDDIFFLWNGTEFELIKFIDNLNQKHPTIRFQFTCS